MPRKRYTAEQIIRHFKACRSAKLAKQKAYQRYAEKIGVSENTYYRWRKMYGGMEVDQARRLKELERENIRLKRAVADLTLDKSNT